jgi:flagellar basal body-associated protein FliL
VKKKLMIVLPILLLAVGGGLYKFVLGPKPAKAAPPKVDGQLYTLSPEFVVNLAQGHYGKVTVAFVMEEAPAAAAEGGETPKLEEDAAVRATITDELTGLPPNALVARAERRQVVARLLKALKRTTDEPVKEVLLTDIAVQ